MTTAKDGSKSFTLIEPTAQLKRAGYLIDGSSISANFPFRADSLTLAAFRATEMNREVTTSREGKPAVRVDDGLHLRHSLETGSQPIAGHLRRSEQATRSQSERLGKRAGRRITNDRKPRKVTPGGYCWQSQGKSEEANLCSMGEACHSRGSKWESAPADLTGVKGDGMCGRTCSAKSGEGLHGSAFLRIRTGIRLITESRTEAVQDVGDGHSTEDPGTMKNPGEGRAISLESGGWKEVPA
jgi:hypothetical protein